MMRGFATMGGIGLIAGVAGLTTLLRPSLLRRAFNIPESEAATYGLRILGMMLTALGLFLGGFSIALRIALASAS